MAFKSPKLMLMLLRLSLMLTGLETSMTEPPLLPIYVFSGLCQFLGNQTNKQRAIARSSTKAEYRALANAASENQWLQILFTELGLSFSQTPTILCDNLGATYLSFNPVNHTCMKHFQNDFHFVHDLVSQGRLQVRHVHTQD
jgi:hypothetical protein